MFNGEKKKGFKIKTPWYKYVWNVICVHYVMFNEKLKFQIKTPWSKFILEFISIHFVIFNEKGL
jgi:hypothetical protein